MSQTLFHLEIRNSDGLTDTHKYYESLTALQMDKGPFLGIKDSQIIAHDWNIRFVGVDSAKRPFAIYKGELQRARDIKRSKQALKDALQPMNRIG